MAYNPLARRPWKGSVALLRSIGRLRKRLLLAGAADGPGIGFAGVRVPDGGGKEFDETPGGALAGGGDEGRQASGQGQRSGCKGGAVSGQSAVSLRGGISFVELLSQNFSLRYPEAWLICAPNPLIREVEAEV
jgi:hypothetical protein